MKAPPFIARVRGVLDAYEAVHGAGSNRRDFLGISGALCLLAAAFWLAAAIFGELP